MNLATRQRMDIWVIAAALVVLFLAASSRSFWIDEAITARFSAPPTLHAWTNMMLTERGGSDPQEPFYLFWTWLWEKIFGDSEWAFRLSGWPWLAAGIALFGWRRPFFAAACALSAFLWYYADEARPYEMQAGLALALMRATMSLAENKLTPRAQFFWQVVLIVSGTLLAVNHLLGMFWTAAYWGFCVLGVKELRQRDNLKRTGAVWIGALLLLGATAGYYLWTISNGVRATDAGVTDLRNVFYAFYELTGLAGLGPDRLEIRQEGLAAFKPFAPQLAAGALLTLALMGVGLVMLLRRLGLKKAALLILAMAGVTLFILGVGVEKHFRVLARHLTPLVPLILWLVAAGAERLWQQHGRRGKTIVVAWALMAAISCGEIHFAPRHAKDDYRSAAAVANAALKKGEVVWWNADFSGAWYYHVPLDKLDTFTPGDAVLILNPPDGLMDSLPRPDCIIATKPDVYDQAGKIEAFAVTNGLQVKQTFAAFKIWER